MRQRKIDISEDETRVLREKFVEFKDVLTSKFYNITTNKKNNCYCEFSWSGTTKLFGYKKIWKNIVSRRKWLITSIKEK